VATDPSVLGLTVTTGAATPLAPIVYEGTEAETGLPVVDTVKSEYVPEPGLVTLIRLTVIGAPEVMMSPPVKLIVTLPPLVAVNVPVLVLPVTLEPLAVPEATDVVAMTKCHPSKASLTRMPETVEKLVGPVDSPMLIVLGGVLPPEATNVVV
jgi:hypothetical protein